MRLRVLGQVEALAHGAPLFLGGPKHRAVLCCLALRANSVVSMDDLLFGLWGRRPPATSRKMLHNIIADLRGVLAQDDEPARQAVLLTHAPGYLLRIDPERVDALRFAREVDEGLRYLRDGDRDRGVQSLRTALDRWPSAVAPASGWPQLLDLWRLRERAASELEAATSAQAQGMVLMITANTAQAPETDMDIERSARHAASVIAVLRDEITRHSGAVHTEFGSLIAAVFADFPGRGGEPGQKRARAALAAIGARLAGNRTTVSAVLASLPSGSGAPNQVPDTLIDQGMGLLALTPSARYCLQTLQ
jgi:hypothetical protein